MATVAKIQGGGIESVYDDRFFPLLKALGSVEVRRATNVEFDEAAQEWVATHLESGRVIGRGSNRSEVIRQEVDWLERKM